jgi:cell wall-associated NlpC family hydrolase
VGRHPLRLAAAVVPVAVAVGAVALVLTSSRSGESPARAAAAAPAHARRAPTAAPRTTTATDAHAPTTSVPPAATTTLPTATAPAAPAHTAAGSTASATHVVLWPGLLGALRASSPWALPPHVELTAPHRGVASASLRRRVLAARFLALAPAAQRSIAGRRVDAGALALLLALPRTGSPHLVFAAGGSVLSLQETNLRATIHVIDGLAALPASAQPAALRLRPAAVDEGDLGKSYAHGSRPSATGERAVQIALRYLGIPYVWGGSTPEGGFDCSGLVMYVYAKLGVHLDHYTGLQWYEGTRIAVPDLLPGDIVFFEPKGADPGHEGLYIGGGRFIQAPHTGDVVKISSLGDPGYVNGYIGAVRPY